MSLEEENQAELGGQMSFLEHLDELRRRLINSIVILAIAFGICFYFSENVFEFLSGIPSNWETFILAQTIDPSGRKNLFSME